MKKTIALWILLASVCRAQTPARFTDITQPSGIHFVHHNGAFGSKYLPETLGPGCAFIDYDNDGYPDILFVNGQDWPGHRQAASPLNRYHNNHNGTFTAVTTSPALSTATHAICSP